MDYDYDEETQLRFDEKDLFSASIALGADVEEYDIEYDAFVKRFKRGEDWNEAISAIRKYEKTTICLVEGL
jgi:enoyl-CoA hydratase/carnithine racemase